MCLTDWQSKHGSRGGNKVIFTLARLASESNFTLASEDLHSPGGENMQNENHWNMSSLILFCMWTKLFLYKISERQRRVPKNVIRLFKILRFDHQFLENYEFDGKFDTRQPEWLQIHTRQSLISLAMASVICTPATVYLQQKLLPVLHVITQLINIC